MKALAIDASLGPTLVAPAVASERNKVIAGSVLLPVDGSPETLIAAEHLALDIGSERGAHVHLLHVTPFMHKHIGRFLSEQAKQGFVAERAATSVEPARRVLERAGVKITVHVSTNLDIAAEVLAVAEREQCARIVMGATRKSRLVGIVTNSVTARVVAMATIPVEVVIGRDASCWQRIGTPVGVAVMVAVLATLLIGLG